MDGTRTVTVVGLAGEMLSRHAYDIASGVLIDRQIYSNFDLELRPQRVEYLDGTCETTSFGCCGVDSSTDREGITTYYRYDELKRLTQTGRLGITNVFVLDALGRQLFRSSNPRNWPQETKRDERRERIAGRVAGIPAGF